MLRRRELLGMMGAAAALPARAWAEPRTGSPRAKSAAPGAVPAGLIEQFLCAPAPALPADALYARDPEAYWAQLRKQWIFRPGFLYLNNGTVGSSPLVVLRAYIESILHEEQMENVDS